MTDGLDGLLRRGVKGVCQAISVKTVCQASMVSSKLTK